MVKVEESARLKKLEEHWSLSVKELFYNWHWEDNLTHEEIAKMVGIPRPTITKWFRRLNIPTQGCQRMTKRRWQIRLVKVLRLAEKQKHQPFQKSCLANKHFFKKWSSEMAYVLGYFAADGCMFVNPRGSHFIDFTSIDRELIEKVKQCLDSRHLLSVHNKDNKNSHWKTRFRLQVGSKVMFKDLLELGLTPRKSKTLKFPSVPDKYLADFIRGYFDGDGCVFYGYYKRNDRKNKTFQYRIGTSFACGSKEFLTKLHALLIQMANVRGGCLSKKAKDKEDFQLAFSTNDSRKIFQFMYNDISKQYFLERKFNKFKQALQGVRK